MFHLCYQHERQSSSGRSRDGSDMVDRGWSTAHFSAHHGMTQLASKVPKPSFDALTPPQGNSSIVNFYGPGGMTPLMVAAMSPASEAVMMDSQSLNHCIQFKPSTIIPDLIAEGASTEDRTDFSGVLCFF